MFFGAGFRAGVEGGQNFKANDMKVALKLGVTKRKNRTSCGDAVMKALAKGTPMEVEEIRASVGNAGP